MTEHAARPPRFTDKVALITGVGERGIGAAIAETLAREGARLLVSDISVSQRLTKRLGRWANELLAVNCDVTSDEQVDAMVSQGVDRFGHFDVIVNNAGVDLAGHLPDHTPDQWQKLMDVNLNGAIRVARATIPHLSEPHGCIVNIASVLGLAGAAGFSMYSASKAGLIGLTRSLAIELSPSKRRCVAIAPAMVETPMVMRHAQHATPEVRAQIAATHPLGIGAPADVAAATAFLASEEARWITGIALPLGWTEHYGLPLSPFLAETS